MKKNAIITFDYELFLGKQTGTIKNCIIKPTQLILNILKKNKAKAIFFVDATWLQYLEKNFPDDLKLVSKQIREIVEIGSSVELHIHPQWLNAIKKGNIINFESYNNYALHCLSQEEILRLFKSSIDILESITQQKIKCFRAGGFCIEPFEQIKPAFEMFEIKYDFSVAPGIHLTSGNPFDFDFSNAPKLINYSFQDEIKIPVANGQFTEFPLSTYNNNPIYRVVNKVILMIRKDKIFGDGLGIQKDLSIFLRLTHKRCGFSKSILMLDQISNVLFKQIIKYHFNNIQLLVVLSHPKTLSYQGLLNLSYLTNLYNTFNTDDLNGMLH